MGSRLARGMRAAMVAASVSLGLAIAKIVTGVLAGSTALRTDGINSAADVAVSLAALAGVWLGEVPPDGEHPYGHRRFETEISRLIALGVIASGVWAAWGALSALRQPSAEPPGWVAWWVGLAALLVKVGLSRHLYRVGTEIQSAALVADASNHRSDVWATGAALVGIVGALWGWGWLDPAAGLTVSGMIVWMGARLYWQATAELVDTAPDSALLAQVRETAQAVPGLILVNEIKARAHGTSLYVELKLCVDRRMTVEAGHEVGRQAKLAIMRRFPQVRDVLVHVNPCHGLDEQACPLPRCPLCQRQARCPSNASEPYPSVPVRASGGRDVSAKWVW